VDFNITDTVTSKGSFTIHYTAYDVATTLSPYPGTTINIPAKTVKVGFEFAPGWKFESPGNTLSLQMYLTPTSNQAPLDAQGYALYGVTPNAMDVSVSFLPDGTVDGVTTPLTSLTSSVTGNQITVTMGFPVFSTTQHFVYDPDFSVILTSSRGDGGEDFIQTGGGIATVVVVPSFCLLVIVAVALGILVTFLMRNRLRARVSTISRRMTSANEIVRPDDDQEAREEGAERDEEDTGDREEEA